MTRRALLAPLLLAAIAVARPAGAQEVACAPPSRAAALPAAVPVELHNNHVYVRACLGGVPLSLILDTGAPNSFLDLGAARRLGVRTGDAFTARGAGAGTVAGARLDRVRVTVAGPWLEHPIANAIDFSGIVAREGHRVDGVLGHDFINRFVVRIDYARGELHLLDRARFTYEGGGTVLPARFIGNFPHVDGEVRLGDGSVVPARLMVDVGGSGAVALGRAWVDSHRLRERVGPVVTQRGGSGVGGATEFDVARVAGVRLGALVVERPVVHLHRDTAGVFGPRGTFDGTVGGELLRRFVVYLDYARGRLILEPHGGTTEPFETDMSGLALEMDSTLSAIVVRRVREGSPGDEAGLAAGDTIVRVDERPAGAAEREELRRRVRRDGERIRVVVRRAGASHERTLVMRRPL